MPLPYSPRDMVAMHDRFGAMCAHGALAAALGVPVAVALAAGWPQGVGPGWVNIPGMERALVACRAKWERVPQRWPRLNGVACIQFKGSWMLPGVPPAARCRHRHMVAAAVLPDPETTLGRAQFIWDANLERWVETVFWEDWLPKLYPKGCTGYEVFRSWEILRENP